MAEKEKKAKRPRHTQLVVPGSGKKKGRYKPVAKDRLGRATPPEATAAPGPSAPPAPGRPSPPPRPPAGEKPAGRAAAPKPNATAPAEHPRPGRAPQAPAAKEAAAKAEAAPPPPGRKTARLTRLPVRKNPKPQKKLSPLKRKRRRRRIRALVALAVAAVVLVVYASGAYLTWGSLLGDAWESLRINARPGEGFPAAFAMNGFIEAEPMGENGFAALGEREVTMFTATGRELPRVQHTYVQPGLSAGDTRVVVYSRGGKEYIVQGRSKTIFRGDTEMDIQFAEMSPKGWLLVATASRYASEVAVYGPTYDTTDPLLVWRDDGDKPIMADFHSDNKNLLLGCVSAQNGALGSTIYVLRTDSDTPVATIRADGALLVELHYLDNHRVLALYDSFAALFNQQGEELARYEYGQRRLASADVWDGGVALLFGGAAQDTLHTVLLNSSLEPRFDAAAEALAGTSAQVLAGASGVFLLQGQEVVAYNLEGLPVGSLTSVEKTLALTHGGQPLLLAAGTAVPLNSLLAVRTAGSANAAATRPAESAGAGLPAESAADDTAAPDANPDEGGP